MSAARGFCPRCGDEIPPGEEFVPPDRRGSADARICQSCYRESLELVSLPESITVHVCTSCGSLREDGTWLDREDPDLTGVAIERLQERLQVHRDAREIHWSVEPDQRGPNELELAVRLTATVHGEPVVEERSVAVEIVRETCDRCGKMAGDHFAATIQVRGDNRSLDADEIDRAVEIAHSVVEETREKGNRSAFVSEVIERSGGVDIRVSTTGLGSSIVSRILAEFGGQSEASERLITEDGDGQRVYRMAYPIHLPQFRSGDIVDLDDDLEPVVIEASVTTVRGRRLTSGERVKIDVESEKPTKIGTIEAVVDTTVVAVEDENAIQILDPETHEARTVAKPTAIPPNVESVRVFKGPEAVYVLAPDIADHETE